MRAQAGRVPGSRCNPVERVTITERLDLCRGPQALALGGAAGVDQLGARGQRLQQVSTKTALTPVRPLFRVDIMSAPYASTVMTGNDAAGSRSDRRPLLLAGLGAACIS